MKSHILEILETNFTWNIFKWKNKTKNPQKSEKPKCFILKSQNKFFNPKLCLLHLLFQTNEITTFHKYKKKEQSPNFTEG